MYKKWNYTNIYPTAEIGDDTTIGSYVEVGGKIGKNCKIQAFSFIPEGIEIGDNVFIGPHVVFCNDKFPYANNKDFKPQRTVVGNNVSIGANCTILPGIEICDDVMIGAGAVVTKSITKAGIYFGNPAKEYIKFICPRGLKKCVGCGMCDSA